MEINYEAAREYLISTEIGIIEGSAPGHKIAQYQPLGRNYQLFGSDGYERLFEVDRSTFHQALSYRYRDITRELDPGALGFRNFADFMGYAARGMIDDETTSWIFSIPNHTGILTLTCRTVEEPDLTRVRPDSWYLSRKDVN